jgi:hypothetical protein
MVTPCGAREAGDAAMIAHRLFLLLARHDALRRTMHGGN